MIFLPRGRGAPLPRQHGYLSQTMRRALQRVNAKGLPRCSMGAREMARLSNIGRMYYSAAARTG
jgi:hypothetical protein